MSSVSETTPAEREDRAQFGQLRTFTWRSFPANSTRVWIGLYLAAFFVTLLANYGISFFQNPLPVSGSEVSSLFMKDRELFWKLRPDTDVVYTRTRIRTNRYGFRGGDPVPGRRVVLCLGDSMTFGYGIREEETFPSQLQARLNAATKSGKLWDVINAAVPSYSSCQTRLAAERLVPRWKPEVVIVCTGGSDSEPVERSDRQTNADRARSLLGVLMEERGLTVRDPKSSVPRCTRDESVANLREIARITRSAGARLIVLGTPVWLLDALNYTLCKNIPEGERWREFYESTLRMAHEQGLKKATEKVEAALAENPGNCCVLWIQGAISALHYDVDTAEELLEQAIEQHPWPMIPKRSHRQALAKVAWEEHAPYINLTDVFFRRTMASPSQKLFLDIGHPTARGYAVIADLVFEAITGQKPPASARTESSKGRAAKETPSVLQSSPGPQPFLVPK
jgi:lysophospholipase L1-like esterase